LIAPGLAFAAEASGIDSVSNLAAVVSGNAEWLNKWIHDALVSPEDEGVMTGVGEYAGTVLGFSRSLSILKNLKTAGVIAAGEPIMEQIHKLPEVPSMPQVAQSLFGITPAQAEETAANAIPAKGTDPNKDFYFVDTPGGKIAVARSGIKDMTKVGGLFARFLAAPEGNLPRGLQTIGRFVARSEGPRPLAGYPEGGNMVLSTPAE
jgi:hypothetical protein